MLANLATICGSLERPIKVLVDTGAEVCLIRRGIIPPHFFQRASKPCRLATADHRVLQGGDKELCCTLHFHAFEVDSRKHIGVKCYAQFLEADISADAILSYEWLAHYNFMVNPRRHGLWTHKEGTADQGN